MKKNTKDDTKKGESLENWMCEPSKRRIGKRCETCEHGEEIKEHIRMFMRHRIAGKTRKRNSELVVWLRENFDYKQKVNTLCRHMRVCESELYVEMRKADIKYKMALGPSKIDNSLGRWNTK